MKKEEQEEFCEKRPFLACLGCFVVGFGSSQMAADADVVCSTVGVLMAWLMAVLLVSGSVVENYLCRYVRNLRRVTADE